MDFILKSLVYDPESLTPDDIATYTRAYARHGGLRGPLEGCRAGEVDVAQGEAAADASLSCLTLPLWSEKFGSRGKVWDFPAIWRKTAEDLTTVSIPRRAHRPHADRPGIINEALPSFPKELEGLTYDPGQPSSRLFHP